MQAARQDIRERAFIFASRIVRLCRHMETKPGSSRIMAYQLLRSGTSVGANIEEAHGSHSRADFIAKMVIAAKEARETLYWIRLLKATELVSASGLAELEDEASQLVAILTSIVIRTRNGVRKNTSA